ncbi:MAG: hypothetical protein KGL39_47220 [Patescibacteria group bacterium]|nr:hypothetical protein [Patescibacteria group bacterium]
MTVAVLFARADSVYKTLPGVEVYDLERDARTYDGPWPVVAHPPCRAWGNFAMFAKPRPDERNLARLSVALVREFGGVLEHPYGSKLWKAQQLPATGDKDQFGGWTLLIDQHWWGHKAQKRTRLYIVGCEPQDIPDMPIVLGEAAFVVGDVGRSGYECKCGHVFAASLGKYGCPNCCGDSGPAKSMNRPEISKAEREHTPPELAEWLVELARRCAVPESERGEL